MKKIALLVVAVAFAAVSQAQLVVGVQGGYYWQQNSTSVNTDKITSSYVVGALQVGYKVMPNLYVGVMGGYVNSVFDTVVATDRYFYDGMYRDVTDHNKHKLREGWTVAPQVKWEFLRFGNMHFNLLLQGQLRMLGANKYTESYITTGAQAMNPNEYLEVEPYDDHITDLTWGVSLRPTLIYEFSEHLSAELMLDLLSIGYVSETETYDPKIDGIDPIKQTNAVFYAGLNSFTDVLRWENTLLKLGFNWTF